MRPAERQSEDVVADLLPLLLETGLLQFGRFHVHGETLPFCFHHELLPSYPDVLQHVARQWKPEIAALTVDRLVSVADALPLGLALSLETAIPLVYSQGSQRPAVYDLIGAYDIGHPAVLLANALSDGEPVVHLVARARSVGLEISTVMVVLDLGTATLTDGLRLRSLLQLSQVVNRLVSDGYLPVGQGRVVQEWIAARAIHRPDSAAP